MFYYVKRFVLLTIILFLVFAVTFLIYFGIQDIFGTNAKKYVQDKYHYQNLEIFVLKTTEYVEKKNEICKAGLFKECSDDANLYKKVTFITKEGNTFTVTEYKDGTFTDDKTDN